MTEDWRNSIDNKEAVAAVAVDFSKAFDAINQRLLLAKLKAYGFFPHALELGTDVRLPARLSTMCQIRRRML